MGATWALRGRYVGATWALRPGAPGGKHLEGSEQSEVVLGVVGHGESDGGLHFNSIQCLCIIIGSGPYELLLGLFAPMFSLQVKKLSWQGCTTSS